MGNNSFKTMNINKIIDEEKIKLENQLNTEITIKEEILEKADDETVITMQVRITNEPQKNNNSGKMEDISNGFSTNIKNKEIDENNKQLFTINNENIKIEKELHTEFIVKDEILTEYVLEPQRINRKKVSCDFCDKTFQYKCQLAVHKRCHTGDKPFLCVYCNKRFSVKATLTTHIRIHTGEKPYSCATCNKKFTTITGLLQHQRIHHGERLLSCKICHKTFTHSRSLNKHKKIHDGEN